MRVVAGATPAGTLQETELGHLRTVRGPDRGMVTLRTNEVEVSTKVVQEPPSASTTRQVVTARWVIRRMPAARRAP
jgi:hypothetical protein